MAIPEDWNRLQEIQFGSTDEMEADVSRSAWRPRSGPKNQEQAFAGLGTGVGGELARDCLCPPAALCQDMDNFCVKSRKDAAVPPHLKKEALPFNEAVGHERRQCGRKAQVALEMTPRDLLMGLLLVDSSPADEKLLEYIRTHRWTFKGAEAIARQGKGFSYFVWCLLHIQQNIQTDFGVRPLEIKQIQACQSFVAVQSRKGGIADMYHLFTHFICSSVIFHEWSMYITKICYDERSGGQNFVAVSLEQVWTRYKFLWQVLQDIFGVLDERYVPKVNLPRIGELLREHVRRTCFSSELVCRHAAFNPSQLQDETMKQISFLIEHKPWKKS